LDRAVVCWLPDRRLLRLPHEYNHRRRDCSRSSKFAAFEYEYRCRRGSTDSTGSTNNTGRVPGLLTVRNTDICKHTDMGSCSIRPDKVGCDWGQRHFQREACKCSCARDCQKAGVLAAGSDTIADTVRHTADIARGGHMEAAF